MVRVRGPLHPRGKLMVASAQPSSGRAFVTFREKKKKKPSLSVFPSLCVKSAFGIRIKKSLKRKEALAGTWLWGSRLKVCSAFQRPCSLHSCTSWRQTGNNEVAVSHVGHAMVSWAFPSTAASFPLKLCLSSESGLGPFSGLKGRIQQESHNPDGAGLYVSLYSENSLQSITHEIYKTHRPFNMVRTIAHYKSLLKKNVLGTSEYAASVREI